MGHSKGSDSISIHTALAGCDYIMDTDYPHLEYFNPHSPRRLWHMLSLVCSWAVGFQSTQPSQAVTTGSNKAAAFKSISIHTALAGCDMLALLVLLMLNDFNPHSPRRLWPSKICLESKPIKFQSTQPSQAVTDFLSKLNFLMAFQSTQPSQAVTAITSNKNNIVANIIIHNGYIFN